MKLLASPGRFAVYPPIFEDEVEIVIAVEEFKGVRLVIGYLMTKASTGELTLTGKTMHCFTDVDGKPIILKNLMSKE